jgi:hypothetical protein
MDVFSRVLTVFLFQRGKLEGGALRRLCEGSREFAPRCARYELRLRDDV